MCVWKKLQGKARVWDFTGFENYAMKGLGERCSATSFDQKCWKGTGAALTLCFDWLAAAELAQQMRKCKTKFVTCKERFLLHIVQALITVHIRNILVSKLSEGI